MQVGNEHTLRQQCIPILLLILTLYNSAFFSFLRGFRFEMKTEKAEVPFDTACILSGCFFKCTCRTTWILRKQRKNRNSFLQSINQSINDDVMHYFVLSESLPCIFYHFPTSTCYLSMLSINEGVSIVGLSPRFPLAFLFAFPSIFTYSSINQSYHARIFHRPAHPVLVALAVTLPQPVPVAVPLPPVPVPVALATVLPPAPLPLP